MLIDFEDIKHKLNSSRAINIVLCHKCINGVQVVGRKEEYVCMMRGELVEKNGYCHKGVLRGEE